MSTGEAYPCQLIPNSNIKTNSDPNLNSNPDQRVVVQGGKSTE